MSLSHFDERSGIVAADTPWGRWWQTVNEVFIEINVPPETPGKLCKISIRPNCIECNVRNEEILKGTLFKTVMPDESTWTLEERKKILILLTKAEKFTHENLWVSLLKDGGFAANPYVQHEMLKKLDLEKFQIEHPGFDFSGADLSKTYDNPPFIPGASNEECR
ncbi:nudC domain-containing protein 2-like [Uloborus diversus]|uniref:nudC domain-containing protein 2-like n=1 Tax=Uloborus diversus TaxID=327109 RepID=UPI002409DA18|nr:nudC domain-containing protein 2-like [Uloborus diversus]